MIERQTTQEKMGRFKRSLLLTKAAWNGLKLDKEVIAFPVISSVLSLAIVIAAFVTASVFIVNGVENPFINLVTSSGSLTQDFSAEFSLKPLGYATIILMSFILMLIGTITTASVIHAALTRFGGGDPTLRGSFSAAMGKIVPLGLFTLFSFTIGTILNEIANRVPYIGPIIIARIADMAWNIASFFAIPVILNDTGMPSPITATKKSLGIIRTTWGESLISTASIGIIALMTILLQSSLTVVITVALGLSGAPAYVIVPVVVITLLGLITTVMVFSALSGYVKASLYYYATTGQSPDSFNRQLAKQAFTPKKARKVFSQ